MIKVLIVEDDFDFRERLNKSFLNAGYETDLAESLDSAITLVKQYQYDWCLCDLKLGNAQGSDLISYLNDTKIIILTGYGSIVSAVDCLKAGAVNYLTKPVSFKEIENAFLGNKVENSNYNPPGLEDVEWEYIQKTLKNNNGNITKTAKDLKIHRRSLQRKLIK